MTIIKLGSWGACIITIATISACGESQKQLDAASQFSCTELAREIGKREQRRDSAQINGVINTIESVIADDKDAETAADIGALTNYIDEADAEKSLEQLEGIYRSKGCY